MIKTQRYLEIHILLLALSLKLFKCGMAIRDNSHSGKTLFPGMSGLLDNMALPTVSTASLTCDTGSELGITLYRQPPLQPPHPPGTYPPDQIRKWWISKTHIDSCSLDDAIKEIKVLFESENWYKLMYYDGLHLMPVVTDKDLRCALNFMLKNSSIARCAASISQK